MRDQTTIAALALAVTACASTAPNQADFSATALSETAAEVAQPSDLQRWQSRFEKKAFQAQSGMILPYRLATPAIHSPRPLVLVLHGSGAIGSDNERQLGPFAASWAQLLDDSRDAPIVLVPQVAERSADYSLCNGSPCASRPGRSFNALLQLLDHFAASSAVDPERIYVVGFSMGGSAALQLALARPKLVAAAVVFAPVPPAPDRTPELTSLPLLAIHGSRDTENPFDVMRPWVTTLNRAGGIATFSIRDGMGHEVPADMLLDVGWRRRLIRGDQ